MNAQHEAEQLRGKLEQLRDTWPEQTCPDLMTLVDMASVARHNGEPMARALVVALRQIRELGELTVRTRYHGTAEWRACKGRDDVGFWRPMYLHAGRSGSSSLGATETRIEFELFIAATIETWRRLRPGLELVDYALDMCPWF